MADPTNPPPAGPPNPVPPGQPPSVTVPGVPGVPGVSGVPVNPPVSVPVVPGTASVGMFFRLVNIVERLSPPQILYLIALFLVGIMVYNAEIDRRDVAEWRANADAQSDKTREQLLSATWELASELRGLRGELKDTRDEVKVLHKAQTDLFIKLLQMQLQNTLNKVKGISAAVDRAITLFSPVEVAPLPRAVYCPAAN